MRLQILFFLCFVVAVAKAQVTGYVISGSVADSAANTPVELVNVILKQKGGDSIVAATNTGADGRFELTGIKAGDYDLHLSFIGYKAKLLPVAVSGN
ncbi:MAG: CarboxypepD reg-like domain, partial [Bacteroidota bacterium]